MEILSNQHRGTGLNIAELSDVPWPSQDAAAALTLLARCPSAAKTPLLDNTDMAARCNVAQVLLKDERNRMGLGSFKALGAAYVIACDAEAGHAAGRTYVTASAGNHGLSVAAGAAAFGANAVIYLSKPVPGAFADRLIAHGAQVVWAGDTYEDSMQAAATAADLNGWALLSDSSWPGYMARPYRLMEGYLALMQEVVEAAKAPTHIFLQAGVGGLAAACATLARATWGDAPVIIVVEPDAAPALIESIRQGTPVETSGPISNMGRLDCKMPSLIALKGLARDADHFVTISEEEGDEGSRVCADLGLATTPSGAAGISALLAASQMRGALALTSNSRVLAFLSEGAEV